MKKLFTFGVLALCLAVSQSARAVEHQDPNSPAVIKAKMLENYLAARDAIRNRDADFLISFQAPEYTSVRPNGSSMNKQQINQGMREAFEHITKINSADIVVKAIEIQPQRVVVLNEWNLDITFHDSNAKTARVTAKILQRDIWVHYQSEWFLKRTEVVKDDTKGVKE